MPVRYIGRFAPSPTGPLHFGSLITAAASFLQAKTNNGVWLLRIEDIDPPREQPGAERWIVDALEVYGFEWDGPVRFQSEFASRHEQLVQTLLSSGNAYSCSCSRKDLANAKRGPLGIVYPGFCRSGCIAEEAAIRIRTDDQPIAFTDRLQGPNEQCLESESGDFIIQRRDGLIAYHLAVVVDDADQGITDVVRGIDLLDSTPRQIHLQRALGFPSPDYWHVPVAINTDGQKLSKLTGAKGIDTQHPGPVLCAALDALGQKPPDSLKAESLSNIWFWAFENWNPHVLQNQKMISATRYDFG